MADHDFNLPQTRALRQTELPHGARFAPFVLTFVRDWRLDGDGAVRPALRVWPMEPGAMSVGESLRGDLGKQYRKVCERAEARHQVVLKPDVGPAGLGGYVVPFDAWNPETKDEQKAYRPRWMSVKNGSQLTKINTAVLDRYIAFWQEQGLIPAGPPEEFVSGRVARLDARVSNHRVKDPELRGYRGRKHAAELEGWARLQEGPAVEVEVPKPAAAKPATPKPAATKPTPVAPAGADTGFAIPDGKAPPIEAGEGAGMGPPASTPPKGKK